MIKKELITAFSVAILGVLVAYFLTSLFMGEIDNFSFKTVNSSTINASLDEPDSEIFNYRAINPTVEVYVGEEEE